MNPLTNKFEMLNWIEPKLEFDTFNLVRPNGEKVPKHWCVLKVGEEIVIKNYTFKIAYIGESNILLEPIGVPIINNCDTK